MPDFYECEMKLIHISDTHLVAPGHALYGIDPGLRLTRCIDSVIEEHADADFCVFTGDLAHAGNSEAYHFLQTQCARLPMPVHFVLGNHDDRQRFCAAFPEAPVNAQGFVQYEIPMGCARGLVLDTSEPHVHHGVFCELRAQWLAERLAEDEAPINLFMHHPPVATGIPPIDQLIINDTRALSLALELVFAWFRDIFL